jgi:regulator of protease activity HflC (stomatin/prohibitin superfamily)
MSDVWLFIIIVLVLSMGLVVMTVKVVDQGYQYTVERFGRYTRTLMPGINFIVPFFDFVTHKVNMKEQVMDIPSQEVITKDNAMVRVDGVVFHQIVSPPEAMYQVDNLGDAILNLTMTNTRTVMGSMDLDELLSKRDEINQRLLRVVDEATNPWGVKILRIEIKDIAPPKELVDAMAKQMKAEREKRASILEAQGSREAAILKAEGEKQATILEAEGRKEAAFRDAEARERYAEAEAKATMMLSQAISRGNIHAINYFLGQRYLAALETIGSAENQKVIMMPLEASSIIGSLAGIGELAKEAFTKKSNDSNAANHSPNPPSNPSPPNPRDSGNTPPTFLS